MASAVAALSSGRWKTVRSQLLSTKISDLGLQIAGSPLEPCVERVLCELAATGLRYRPRFYLSDSWGCPNEVPEIGIPFYLADPRLTRIEEEQTGIVEDEPTIMMLLRHEAGHAVNYAYRLWKNEEWTDTFGAFSRPYRDVFAPEFYSREFVRHLFSPPYGRTYAQKHPDEDFAETFAVWMTPGSGWRRQYRSWPALRKLTYVDGSMRRIRNKRPVQTYGRRVAPVEKLQRPLREHYGDLAERMYAQAAGA